MLDKALHATALGKILYAIYTDPYLRSRLVFKGGTACYFLYDLPRFSTDLDFNLLSPEESEEVFRRMLVLLAPLMKMKDSHRKRHTLFFLLSYKHAACNIKLEVNLRTFPHDQHSLRHYLGLPLNVLDRKYIAAHKFVAITDRNTMVMRDIFDAHFFLKNDWPIDGETILYRTKKDLSEYFRTLAAFIEKRQPLDILQGIGELLDEKQKKWVKVHLVDELLFLLRSYADAAEGR